MSAWLTINGIELAAVVALKDDVEGPRRDIGSKGEASDGSLILTRQARKRDLKFGTVPLSGPDAAAWEGLLTGESHVWSFDVSKYSSKGRGPTLNDGTLESAAPAPVYGAKYLRLPASDSVSYEGVYEVDRTVAAWVQFPGLIDEWTHYVETSEGHRWRDGVRDDSFDLSAIFAFATGTLTIVNGSSFVLDVDDLVVSPFLWPEDWPAQVFAADAPFGPTPYLTAAGLLVREAATRRMVCEKCDERVTKANLSDGNGLVPDVRVLEVELKAA